jgi:quercetin dioxygenase-like cupin family protein
MGIDPVEVAPNIYTVLFENERVRLLRVQIEPGGSSPIHSHPAYLAYALAPGKLTFTSESGDKEEFELDAGQVAWRDVETHSTDAGPTGVDGLLFELK